MRSSRAALAGWAGLVVSVVARAAPLGTIAFDSEGGVTTTMVHVEGARLRVAPRDGAAPWSLEMTPTGPRLAPATGGAEAAPCDATLFASLSVVDADGDGRVDETRGDHARVLVSANWREGELWRAAVLSLELRAGGSGVLRWRADSAVLSALGRLTAPPTLVHAGRPDGAGDIVVIASGWPPIASSPPAGALLAFDAASGRPLAPLFTTDAPLVSGVTAVDLDADGRDDRLYVADARWRVWRLDRARLATGAGSSFDATRLADLGALAEPGAAFQFAPDVALAALGAGRALEVTLGSSNVPGRLASRHWLVVLRDPLPPHGGSGAPVQLSPLRPSDLQRLDAAGDPGAALPASGGLLVALPGPLATAPITIAGHRLVATHPGAEPHRCTLRVDEPLAVDVLTLTPTLELRSRSMTAEPGAAFSLAISPSATPGSSPTLACSLGTTPLPQCPRVDAVTRDYWVRRDAP